MKIFLTEYQIYLLTPGIGFSYPDGTFKIEIKVGYTIKNGIISSAIQNKLVKCSIIDFLENITMISDETKITGAFCNKGGLTYLGMGGPCIKTKAKIDI